MRKGRTLEGEFTDGGDEERHEVAHEVREEEPHRHIVVSEGLERVGYQHEDGREVHGERGRHVGKEDEDERKEDHETGDLHAGEEVDDAGTVVESALEDGGSRHDDGGGGNFGNGFREDEAPSLHEKQEGHVEKHEIPRKKGDVDELLANEVRVYSHRLVRAGEDDGISVDFEHVEGGGAGSHGTIGYRRVT